LTAAISAWCRRGMSSAALYRFGLRAAVAYPHFERSDDAIRSSALVAALTVATLLDKINFCPSRLQNTRPRMNVVGVKSLSDWGLGLSPMSLGGPLPRAQSPRAGRVLSRGKDCRATEPPTASRPIRVTPATAVPAVPSTIQPSSLATATATSTARAARAFGTSTPLLGAYQLPASRARLFAFFGLSELYRSSLRSCRSRGASTGRRLVLALRS